MINYHEMLYGYSFDMNITDLCNIHCEHCYMKKTPNVLDFAAAQAILSKLPVTLKRLVISGGEPFLNYNVMYQIIRYAKSRFPNVKIRITSNAKYFYENEETIKYELQKMERYGVDEIRISADQYHIKAGIDLNRLLSVASIAHSMGVGVKVSYIDIGKGRPIGEFKETDENLVSKDKCLNRGDNIFSPYLFMNTDGHVYLCAFRLTESLGNLLYDDWKTIAENINKQYNFLSGNILSVVARKLCDTSEVYRLYQKYGECYLCEKYQKISKNDRGI